MTEDWKPDAFKDTYRDDLLAMISKRVKANQTAVLNEEEVSVPKASSNVVDIMALLKKSIESKTQKSGAKSAKPERKIERTKSSSQPKATSKIKTKSVQARKTA
jgi:DNA end-binding protein Ku